MWYEETGSYFQVAPDGGRAIYGSGPRSRLYDLVTGEEASAVWRKSMDGVRGGGFMPSGALVRLGTAGGDTGWFVDSGDRLMGVEPLSPGIMAEGLDFLQLLQTDGFQGLTRFFRHHPALLSRRSTPLREG